MRALIIERFDSSRLDGAVFLFMPRISNKDVLADRQQPDQPALFDDAQFPVCLPVLEAVRAKRYEFKGVRLVEDEDKALRLVELLVARWGVKKISREMHISSHTVRAARRELTRQGKLAPYVQRVVESMEDAIEAGINNYRDALEDGRINPTQIPVGLGIIFDKRQLATNQATSISARMEAGGEDLKVEDLNRYLEALPSANAVPTDSASTGLATKPQNLPQSSVPDDSSDVGRDQPADTLPPESGSSNGRPGPRPGPDGRDEGGGGGLDRPALD